MPYRSDLPLAWRRTKADIQTNRIFVRTPYEIELVDQNTEEWLSQLSDKVTAGYRPGSAIIADIPKGNGAIRPAALLSLEDRTVYADIVGSLLPTISAGLRWSQGSIDFSYQLASQPDRVNWFTNRFAGWTQFRRKQLERVEGDENITHVVITDLTGFYENIVSQLLCLIFGTSVATQTRYDFSLPAYIGGQLSRSRNPSRVLGI
jgi:hypothetical protein